MKHRNQSELAPKLTMLVGLCIMVVMLLSFSQAAVVRADPLALAATPEPNNKYFTTITTTLSNGKSVDEYIINGPPNPPPGYELERAAVALPKPNPAMATNSLIVPAFNWVFGCSSVTGSMIAGYYDRNGFPNMYTGPTDGGVMPLDNSSWGTWSDGFNTYPNIPLAASHQGVDGRATKGSIDDYWVQYNSSASDPYITGSWTQHTWSDAIGDYMKTSQSAYSNDDGSTSFYNYTTSAAQLTCADMLSGGISTSDGTYGRKLFYEARGYTVTDCYSQKTDNTVAGGFSFAQFKAEIDAGRPVMLNLAGHTIAGVGYDDTGNTVTIHDTWDYLNHSMTWGGSYSGMNLLSVSIVNLQSAVPTGILSGTVTDSAAAPIVGATIDVSGGHTTTTDGTGHYTLNLAAGTYSVTASKYGYVPGTAPSVVVTPPGTTTQNFTLAAAAPATVSGHVTDATTGWPLYAGIDIPGYPDGTVWTDPVTGAYNVTLPDGGTYAFSVNAWVPGYNTGSRAVGPLAGNRTENFALTADTATCNAPGYTSTGFAENFDSATPPALPANWAKVDVSGTAGDWVTHVGTVHPSGVSAHSGTNLAYFNSWTASSGNQTRLYRTTGLNMTTLSSSTLTFWMYHDTGYSGVNDRIQVQVSTGGGGIWNNVGAAVSRYDGSVGWKQHSVDLSAYASQTDLRLGFLGISAWGNDTHIDDISLGTPACDAQSGGLVVGNVYNANTNAPLVGATVSNDSGYTTTTATTTDPDVDDGFYTLFSPAGSHSFTASKSGYGSDTANVGVILNSTVQHDFHLAAPSLSFAPPTLQATLQLGNSVTIPFTLTNNGGLPATFELQERNGGFTLALSGGSSRTLVTVPPSYGKVDAITIAGVNARKTSSATLHSPGWTYYDATPLAGGLANVLLLYADTNTYGEPLRTILDSYADIGTIGMWDARASGAGTPTLADLMPYDVVIAWCNSTFADRIAIGNVLADYVDAGGGVILTPFDWHSTTDLGGRIITGGYSPFITNGGGSHYPTSANLGIYDASHPIMQGVTAVSSTWRDYVDIDSGATLVASWSDGEEFIAVKDRVVGINSWTGTAYAPWTGDLGIIFHNAINYLKSGFDIPWLSESPLTGTIPAGGSQVINITFDASTVTQNGQYDGILHILSNDPVNPDFAVPVTMTVTDTNPVPTTTGLSPASATAGGAAFILTVNGTNFVNGSTVRWNGSNRTTTYVSSTQLTVSIPAADIAAGGTASVTVFNGTPGGGTSNAQTFTINTTYRISLPLVIR